jgi:hypothetical protein
MSQNPSLKDPVVSVSPWKASLTNGIASTGLYIVSNYAVNGITKAAMKKKGADPAAIKSIRSGGQIIKQGGLQFASSVGSTMAYDPYIRRYIPPDWYSIADPLIPASITGAAKAGLGLLFDGKPSWWNGITDFVISTGTDAGARAWTQPTMYSPVVLAK